MRNLKWSKIKPHDEKVACLRLARIGAELTAPDHLGVKADCPYKSHYYHINSPPVQKASAQTRLSELTSIE